MLGRILLGLVLCGIPAGMYYYKGFEWAVISALILIILLIVNHTEEVRDIKEILLEIKKKIEDKNGKI